MARKLKQESIVTRKARRSKSKGREGENEVVKLLAKYGIKAERVPLSGALKTEKYSCDVRLANGKRIEVKRRKTGMKTIKKWLEEDKNSNYVFFREDYGNWLVIMDVNEFIGLLSDNS